MSQLDNSYGPVTSASAITSTGGKSWVKPRGLLNNWGYTITTAGSTSAVTSKHRLEGTLSDAAAPAAADIFTLSTGSGAGHVRTTGKIARQVRINVTTLSSTSGAGPTLTAVVAGTL